MDGGTDEWVDGWRGRRMKGWMDGWMDGWMGGETFPASQH